ncbi:MAG TPA: hypothetical protein VGH21_02480 [Solirubrobacteraceae bacterium]|jgi:hypothetical protein
MSAVRRTSRLLVVSAVAVAFASIVGASSAAPARDARSVALNESGQLHLTSRHGFTLDERGTAYGSVSGSIFVHLTIVSTSRVVAEVNLYPPGGSISGQASASYHRGGSTASFAGTISIVKGTGRYAHARGSGLSFSGTIRRSDEAISVRVRGTVDE